MASGVGYPPLPRVVDYQDAPKGGKLQKNFDVTFGDLDTSFQYMGSLLTSHQATKVVPPDPRVGDISEIINHHGRVMFRVAVAIVRDSALAEDVVQEAIIKAWLKLDTFRGDGSFRGWLLRIVHNTAVSMIRSNREQPWDPQWIPPRTAPSAEQQAVAANELEAAISTFARLDPLSRTIVTLREGEGFTYDEIAEALGVTIGQVKIRLLRARRRLATAVERGEA